METRYYIGLLGGLHVMFKIGPGDPNQFAQGPLELMALSDTTFAYPVSAEIAERWVADDDD
jgi:hypothetical protein